MTSNILNRDFPTTSHTTGGTVVGMVEDAIDKVTGSEFATTVNHAASNAADAARDMGDSVAKEAKALASEAGAAKQRVSEAARQAAHNVTDGAHHLADSARHHALQTTEQAQRYVRDEPVKAVLIAAAVGAALTSLLMLASRRHH